ncbi:hypothetical protein [Hoeflea alexandrii]
MPIIVNGTYYGTINCLTRPAITLPERVAASDTLKLPGAAASCSTNPYHPGVCSNGKQNHALQPMSAALLLIWSVLKPMLTTGKPPSYRKIGHDAA